MVYIWRRSGVLNLEPRDINQGAKVQDLLTTEGLRRSEATTNKKKTNFITELEATGVDSP